MESSTFIMAILDKAEETVIADIELINNIPQKHRTKIPHFPEFPAAVPRIDDYDRSMIFLNHLCQKHIHFSFPNT